MPPMTDRQPEILWVTWEVQRRNRSISQRLGARLLEIDGVGQGRLARYLRSSVRTVLTAVREKPDAIVASNPSMVLASLAVVLGKALRRPVLIDTHNVGIRVNGGEGSLGDYLATAIARGADVTIVHNDDLVDEVRKRGGRPFVLPDPVPELPARDEASRFPLFTGKQNVLYVCTYDADEPYAEVARAGAYLPPDVHVYVSGRRKERLLALGPPPNVIPTGFLSEQDYVRALEAADVVMVLTTMADCAQCGAYEAVSAGRPMVLTGTTTLRTIFSRGAVYTENRPEDIARAIQQALAEKRELGKQVARLRDELVAGWGQRLDGFRGLVQGLARGA